MSFSSLFRDRSHAGDEMASAIATKLAQNPASSGAAPIVYALPKGGLPVAEPIARRLQCPLSVIVAKKITHPDNSELALGAVTADGCVLWSKRQPEDQEERRILLQPAQQKAEEQWQSFAASCPSINPEGMLALLVDDGIATGMTMAVALQSLRARCPAEIWICVPVIPLEQVQSFRSYCDQLIALKAPRMFLSVGRFYQSFTQVDLPTAISYLQMQQEWRSPSR
ncbi:MAG: phosphoribosyltransferase [Microcoleaceae cyanobacterium]